MSNAQLLRAQKLFSKLNTLFPDARMILHYSNPWECLVAVMLSAQCTDVQVNKVTKQLFKKYQTFDDYIQAKRSAFEKDIFSTGFYRNKTKHILAAARMLQKEFGGSVPKTMEELVRLPGVARKTANVVLGNCFGVYEGIAVDTHVARLSRVLKLTKNTTPLTIEQDLMRLFPREKWFSLTYLLIEYGRKYCTARKHTHEKCPLYDLTF